jgi:adenylate cyclase
MRFPHISRITKSRVKSVLSIALLWTITDYIIVLYRENFSSLHPIRNLEIREGVIFLLSIIMGYLFVFKLKRLFRKYPLWLNFILTSLILILSAFLIVFTVHFVNSLFIQRISTREAFNKIIDYALYKDWLLTKIIYWLIVFFITQLFVTLNDKYAPGVFIDIMLGKYLQPQTEKRIVMFMDLKDSTPTAEKLGDMQYFKFLREFIYLISAAIIEFEGSIYQYVGDEVIASWPLNNKNARKCMDAIIEARKNIQKQSEEFRKLYNVVPEFRVGIHVGNVTMGEIGVLKKDLAMSGDTMNTTARIRSACNELNHKFIVSKSFMDNIDLKEWQSEDLGLIDLKGKAEGIELYALKI